MVSYSNRRPENELVSRYNGPKTSEMTAILLGVDDGIVGRQEIVLRKRRLLNAHENEIFDTIPVTLYSMIFGIQIFH